MTPSAFIAAAFARRRTQDLARSALPDAPISAPEDSRAQHRRRVRSALAGVLRRAANLLDDRADVTAAPASG
jgi:hypothetical protein